MELESVASKVVEEALAEELEESLEGEDIEVFIQPVGQTVLSLLAFRLIHP